LPLSAIRWYHTTPTSRPNRLAHWSVRAHAASWFLCTRDFVTGGSRFILDRLTPITMLCPRGARAGRPIRTLLLEEDSLSRPRSPPATHRIEGLPTIFANAAGIDIGADAIVVAVPPDRDPQPMRAFRTFTPDLAALGAWLLECRIDTGARESTGVDWVPIDDLLEQHGIVPYLVNGRHVKTVPGRKRDGNDALWLQTLHALGRLAAAFRPDAEIAALRTLVRYRAERIQHRAPHLLPIQKAMQQMNMQLERVLSDSMGVTGQASIRAIVAGERAPVALAKLRNPACTASEELIAKALTGTWKPALLFVLEQALVIYDVYSAQIAVCDAELEQYLPQMEARSGDPQAPLPDLPPAKTDWHAKNAPNVKARAHDARVLGVDLVTVMGVSASSVQTIISTIGTARSRFPTVKHCCAWRGLAPRNDISGGKVLRSRTRNVTNRATQACRQAAQSVSRSDSAVGAYDRAMRVRKGPEQANVATAHKIARIVYHLLKYGEAYEAESAAAYEQQRQERAVRVLTRRAAKLGYTLTAVQEPSPDPLP
jgi:transposase